jgi:NAD(P)-dependent dehydrogenase (short-subunit alcohol dehydrogenase family)
VLIVNTNGGGHANIGFWLAKTLAAQGHQVTLNVVGDADDAKMQKPPFSYFGELASAGVRTVWADPGDLASKAGGEQFDVGRGQQRQGPRVGRAPSRTTP